MLMSTCRSHRCVFKIHKYVYDNDTYTQYCVIHYNLCIPQPHILVALIRWQAISRLHTKAATLLRWFKQKLQLQRHRLLRKLNRILVAHLRRSSRQSRQGLNKDGCQNQRGNPWLSSRQSCRHLHGHGPRLQHRHPRLLQRCFTHLKQHLQLQQHLRQP